MEAIKKISKVNDICLYVKDFQNSMKFYQEKFGFKVKRIQPNAEDPQYVEFEFQGTTVSIWDRAGVLTILDEKHLGTDGHGFMIAIKVATLADVDEIYDALTSRGVVCISKPVTYEFGARASYYTDYENNIWEIFAWEEGDGPGLL